MPIVILLSILLCCLLSKSEAFSIHSLHQQQSVIDRRTTAISPSSLLSSAADNGNANSDDDELSKLIDRRNQIKRKKKEKQEEEIVPYEPTVDLNLDKLPEFKTERPARRRANSEQKDSESSNDGDGDAKNDKSKKDLPIIDFKGDYDDENDLHVTNRIIASTISWGDPKRNFCASGKLTKRMIKEGKFVPGDLQLAHEKLLENGITFVESSPAYGLASQSAKLSAQHILHRCLQESPKELPETLIVNTLGTSIWSKLTPKRITQSLYDSVELLECSTVELFQVPKSSLYPSTLIVSALSAAVESGCCNYVGVQGVTSKRKLAKISRGLEAADMSLTSNSFEFSLTNRKLEYLFDVCKDLNIIPLVTNPIDDGLASGVYTATNPSGGRTTSLGRPKFSFKELEKLQPLHSVQETVAERVQTRVKREMREIQEKYRPRYGPAPKINTDITTTQVALNYVIAKGGVPMVEVNSPKDAEEVAGSLGWTLTDEEVTMLDNAAALCKL